MAIADVDRGTSACRSPGMTLVICRPMQLADVQLIVAMGPPDM